MITRGRIYTGTEGQSETFRKWKKQPLYGFATTSTVPLWLLILTGRREPVLGLRSKGGQLGNSHQIDEEGRDKKNAHSNAYDYIRWAESFCVVMRDKEGENCETWMPWIPQGYGREHLRYLGNVTNIRCSDGFNNAPNNTVTGAKEGEFWKGASHTLSSIKTTCTVYSWFAQNYWREHLYW